MTLLDDEGARQQQRLVLVTGRRIAEVITYGCSDGHCHLVRRPAGMHTNGGCRCYATLADLGLEMAAAADRLRHRRGLAPLMEGADEMERHLAASSQGGPTTATDHRPPIEHGASVDPTRGGR